MALALIINVISFSFWSLVSMALLVPCKKLELPYTFVKTEFHSTYMVSVKPLLNAFRFKLSIAELLSRQLLLSFILENEITRIWARN